MIKVEPPPLFQPRVEQNFYPPPRLSTPHLKKNVDPQPPFGQFEHWLFALYYIYLFQFINFISFLHVCIIMQLEQIWMFYAELNDYQTPQMTSYGGSQLPSILLIYF